LRPVGHLVQRQEERAHRLVALRRRPPDLQHALVRTQRQGGLLLRGAELQQGPALLLEAPDLEAALADDKASHATAEAESRRRGGAKAAARAWPRRLCSTAGRPGEVAGLQPAAVRQLLQHDVGHGGGGQGLLLRPLDDHRVVRHADDALPAYVQVRAGAPHDLVDLGALGADDGAHDARRDDEHEDALLVSRDALARPQVLQDEAACLLLLLSRTLQRNDLVAQRLGRIALAGDADPGTGGLLQCTPALRAEDRLHSVLGHEAAPGHAETHGGRPRGARG